MTNTHVGDPMLADYANGSLSDGMGLLVASHLTFCPACRAKAARLETIGGALLALEDPVPPDPDTLLRVLERIAAEEPSAQAPVHDGALPLPSPLRERLGPGASQIHWRFLMPGLSEHRLDGFDGEQVTLLRAKPGVRILPHTHSATEATLVLAGQLRDGDRVYSRGDVTIADDTHDHRPEIVGDETCICLIVLSGRLRFTGPIGRALNLLTR